MLKNLRFRRHDRLPMGQVGSHEMTPRQADADDLVVPFHRVRVALECLLQSSSLWRENKKESAKSCAIEFPADFLETANQVVSKAADLVEARTRFSNSFSALMAIPEFADGANSDLAVELVTAAIDMEGTAMAFGVAKARIG